MAITETKRHQEFRNGVLQNEQTVVADITTEAVARDINTKMRAYLNAAATFLALPNPTNAQIAAQVNRNTRSIVALVRLTATDLLVESTDI